MTPEELKSVFESELKAFKATIPQLQDVESLKTAIAEFKKEVNTKFDGIEKSDAMKNLEEAVSKQGETLAALKLQGESQKKGIRDFLVSKQDSLNKLSTGEIKSFKFETTTKDVISTNLSNSTLAYRDAGVGQIQRGVPFMADLFPKIILGNNNGGTVRWSEQVSVTNSASAIAEATAPTIQSSMTWGEKSLEGKRLVDFVKIGLDMVKDVDYVLGEVQALVNKNMKLKENDALINGSGEGEEMKGLLTYAEVFRTAGIKIDSPNLVDLVNRMGLQVTMDMLGGAAATNFISSPVDIQPLKEAKATDGKYLFEAWALGQNPSIGGVSFVSNPLVAQNTLIAGDFTLGTLFIFDDLLIELVRTENDELKRMVTIMAYKRENLRIKDVDKKAFVYVSSITDTLSLIDASV